MNKQNIEVDTWKEIRSQLNGNYDFSEGWEKAVELFRGRINKKYFKPVERLINSNLREGEGFAIVTIQCALIEMFAAFKEGQIYNRDKPDVDGISYEYKDSRDLFVQFLNSAEIFRKIFFNDVGGTRQTDIPFSRDKFYSNVRCGLMHEARTKKDWQINATENDNPNDKMFIKRRLEGNIIYRTPLHYSLVEYFDEYCDNLRNNHLKYNDLRRKFARKLDDLYDLNSPDEKYTYEWWREQELN